MSDDAPPPQDSNDPPHPPGPGGGQFSQHVQHTPVAARVPDAVSRGVFSTGVLVQTGRHEFVLDFLLMISRPHQVAARIVMPFAVVQSFIQAMRQNLEAYTQRFGPPPELPRSSSGGQQQQPSEPPPIEEIYGQLKLSDEIATGVYANTVMITHSPSEFVFDFITNFYPKSTVSSRVFLTASQVPRFLESLARSFDQFQRRLQQPPGGGGAPPPGPPQPPGPPTDYA